MVGLKHFHEFLANPKNKRYTSVSTLSSDDVASIWNVLSEYVELQMRSKKGVHITNLGTFSFTLIKLEIGNNKHVLIQRPVFVVSEKFAQLHRLQYTKYHTTGETAIASLNYTALSLNTPFDRDTVETCVREILQSLSRAVANSQSIEFLFRGIGILSIKNAKVKMKFFKDFVNSLDESGSLLKTMENRPGTSASVMTAQTTLSAQHRPETRTLTLPKLNQAQDLLPPILEDEKKQDSGDSSPLPQSQSSKRQLIRPHTVEGISSEDLNQVILKEKLKRKVSTPVNRSTGNSKPDIDFTPTTKSSLCGSSSPRTESSAVLQAPVPPAGVCVGGGRPRAGSWVCFSPDRHKISPGERLCPLCRWKSTRNFSTFYEKERKRKQQESDALLEQYQQTKDQETDALQQVKQTQIRRDNQKVAAFNLGVAEGIREAKNARSSQFERSYVFQNRALTPLPYTKRMEYSKVLDDQVVLRRSREDREKLDELFQGRLEQVQLAEDLAAQRDQFVRAKTDQILEYQRALDAQVDNKKRRLSDILAAEGCRESESFSIPQSSSQFPFRLPKFSSSSLTSDEIRGKHPPLPKSESDSKMPIFGKYDSNNFNILRDKERARSLMREQMESVSEKKRKILEQQMTKRKEENETLKEDRKLMVADRIACYAFDVGARKALEENWRKHHCEKMRREEEERLRMSDSGLLLLQKMESDKHCNQCRRGIQNCGESNLWTESRYLSGSKIMI